MENQLNWKLRKCAAAVVPEAVVVQDLGHDLTAGHDQEADLAVDPVHAVDLDLDPSQDQEADHTLVLDQDQDHQKGSVPEDLAAAPNPNPAVDPGPSLVLAPNLETSLQKDQGMKEKRKKKPKITQKTMMKR